MKPTVTTLLLVFLACLELQAADSFGTLGHLQQRLPGVKAKGFVGTITQHGRQYYIFTGQAEKLFGGTDGEQDWELYQEAELSAKSHFLKSLTQGNPNLSVTMQQANVLHHVNDGTFYTVILAVPADKVAITPTPPEAKIASQRASSQQAIPPDNAEKPTDDKAADKQATTVTSAHHIKPSAPSNPERLTRKKTIYRKRIAETPDNPYNFQLLGNVYEQTHETDKALNCYMSMLRLMLRNQTNPTEALTAMEHISRYAEQHERYAEALKCQRLIQKMGNQRQRQQATIAISRLNVKSRMR